MKKLNKALGRKRVIDLPDHDLIETFVRGTLKSYSIRVVGR